MFIPCRLFSIVIVTLYEGRIFGWVLTNIQSALKTVPYSSTPIITLSFTISDLKNKVLIIKEKGNFHFRLHNLYRLLRKLLLMDFTCLSYL